MVNGATMKIAVIADIHANVPALEAVLEAIATHGVDEIVCLGDLVGYNAEPARAVELVRQHADRIVAGNHDQDVSQGRIYPGTNSVAARSAVWTRQQLSAETLAWLGALPERIVVPDAFVAVHGCYLSEATHTTGYVTATMLETNLHAIAARVDWPKVALCGHTHLPLAGWIGQRSYAERTLETTERWPASAAAVLINPGAVGQPRDGDPRASYAVLDFAERMVTVHRVAYDIDRAAAAILAAGLPDVLANRLRVGR